MKKKKEEPTSIFKRKGFYVALYSCVGVVLISAALVTYYNNNKTSVPNGQVAELNTEGPESIITSQSGVESYTAKITSKPSSTPKPAYTAPVITYGYDDDEEYDAYAHAAPPLTLALQETAKTNTSEPKPEQNIVYAEPIKDNPADGYLISSTQNQDLINSIANNLDESQAVFNTFTNGQQMSWPVIGEIVMDYSVDHTILDTTLEQYRTNASISIEAAVGTQVKSAADGIVTQVYNTKEKGNVVVVDHGNGWETTYSQLQNTLLVESGDVISEGQVIGGVASPSNHSIMQGNHLEFAVTKDKQSEDPKNVLK